MIVSWFGRRRSIRRQLILWNSAALALLFIGLGTVARLAVQTTMLASVDQELSRRMDMFHQPRPPRTPGGPPDGAPDRPGGGPPGSGFNGPHIHATERDPYPPITFGADERRVSRENQRPYDPEHLGLALDNVDTDSTVSFNGERIRVRSIHLPSGGAAQAAYPLVDVERALGGLTGTLVGLIPLVLALSIVGSVFVTGRVLARVQTIAESAEAIGGKDLSRRLAAEGDDEFSDLAGTFNGMLERLESAFGEQARLLERQRQFTADASHELRTPLTVIKGNSSIETKSSGSADSLKLRLAEIDRSADTMVKLVNDLLLLARSDGGQLGGSRVDILVRDAVERAISNVRSAYPDCAYQLDIDDDSATVNANESELVRTFSNLIDNAARHGSRATVAVSTDGEFIVVRILDDGPGIEAEHLSHLGERFYRVDDSRTGATGGTGLGLSICRGIVDAHGGSLTIDSVMGIGTSVTVRLPRVG